MNYKLTCATLGLAFAFSFSIVFAQSSSPEIELAEHDLLMQEIEAGQQVLESARARLVGMLSKTDEFTSQASELDVERALTRKQLLALDADINAKRDEITKTRRQIRRIKSIQDARQAELDVLNTKLAALKQRKKSDAVILLSAHEESEKSAATLKQLDAELQVGTKEIQSLRDEIAKMNLELEATKKTVEKAQQDRVQVVNKATTKQSNLARLEANEAQIRARHEATAQQLESEKAKLKQVLDSIAQADADKDQLNNDGDKIEQELTRLQAGSQSNKQELLNTSNQLARAQRLLDSKQGEVLTLRARLESLEEQQKISQAGAASINIEVDQHANRKQALDRELQLASEEEQKLQQLIASKESDLSAATKAVNESALLKKAKQQELQDLQNSLAASQKVSSEVGARFDTASQQLTQQTAKLGAIKAEIADLQEQTKQVREALPLGDNVAVTDNETLEVVAQLNEVEAELMRQKSLLQAEKLAYQKAGVERGTKQSQLRVLEQDNFKLWEKIGWTKLRLEQSEKELAKEKRKTKKITDKLAKLEAELKGEQEVAARLKQQHDTQLQRKAEIDAEMSKLQSSVSSKQSLE